MRIVIRSQGEQPIYAQIRQQLREQILSGALPEGTVLPSIRRLAQELGVSVITTARAYAELEKEGFIASEQGRGTVVLSCDNQLLREQFLRRIEEALSAAIETARALSLSREELCGMLDLLWQE